MHHELYTKRNMLQNTFHGIALQNMGIPHKSIVVHINLEKPISA